MIDKKQELWNFMERTLPTLHSTMARFFRDLIKEYPQILSERVISFYREDSDKVGTMLFEVTDDGKKYELFIREVQEWK